MGSKEATNSLPRKYWATMINYPKAKAQMIFEAYRIIRIVINSRKDNKMASKLKSEEAH